MQTVQTTPVQEEEFDQAAADEAVNKLTRIWHQHRATSCVDVMKAHEAYVTCKALGVQTVSTPEGLIVLSLDDVWEGVLEQFFDAGDYMRAFTSPPEEVITAVKQGEAWESFEERVMEISQRRSRNRG